MTHCAEMFGAWEFSKRLMNSSLKIPPSLCPRSLRDRPDPAHLRRALEASPASWRVVGSRQRCEAQALVGTWVQVAIPKTFLRGD